MAFSNAAKNTMLDHIGGLAVFVSLHTADPATTGANEVVGGAYTRESVTWNASAGGNLDSSNQPVFDVPGGTTITHVGFWSAASGGVWYGGDQLDAPETYGSDGQFTLTDADFTIV